MALQYLVVDMRRVLDECVAGQAAATALQVRFDEARGRWQALVDASDQASGGQRDALLAEAKNFEQSSIQAFAEERERSRAALLQRAAPLLAEIAESHGATLVLEREGVLLFDAAVDATDELIARLDAA